MLQFIWERKRWIPLIIYLALAFVLWATRAALIYSHLPTLFGGRGVFLYDLVFVAVAVLLFVCILQELRCPFLTKARVERAFKQAGLKNGLGQYPVLVSITEDPRKKHGMRYTIKNMGVSIPDMERKIDSLQREIGAVYEMLYSPKTTHTYLYVLPRKSLLTAIPPTVYDDEF